MNKVQLFTTPIIDGISIEKYFGVVTANQVAGTGFFTDFTASISDFFGGNSGAYRDSMDQLCSDVTERLKEKAAELGANAIVGVSIDYDSISAKNMSMFMVSIQGTAVRIADSDIETCESKEKVISWYELNLAYRKRKICKKIEMGDPITEEQWDFLLKNDVMDLTPSLYLYYQKCKKKSEDDYVTWVFQGLSNFKEYLSKLDYKDAIMYVYKDVSEFKDIIIKNKLFSASNILKIAQEGQLDIAISLLNVEKTSYNIQDLSEMQELSQYLQNLPDVWRIEDVKGGLFSSGGKMYICSCGAKNGLSSKYCNDCDKNIKGVTKKEQIAINNYVELVDMLTEILK